MNFRSLGKKFALTLTVALFLSVEHPGAQGESGTSRTHGEDWPEFRGAARDGRYTGPPILTAWPRGGPALMWRREVGDGYGSMAIVEGRLFTMERHGNTEGVHAYDARTGQDRWRDRFDTDFKRILGNDGSQTTPTLNSGRVYTLGVTGEFRCLDATTGRLLWRHDIVLEHGATLPEWGLAASPLVVDDKVIVLPGGPAGRSVVAYDKVSGREVWSSLDDRQAYTAPMLAILDGVRQILIVSAARVAGLRIEDGALLWQHPWRTTELGLNIAQPLVFNGTAIVLSAGYGHGAAMLDVRRTNGTFRARQLWATRELESKFNAPVLFGRHLYGFDEQDLVCLDLETGQATWRQRGTFGFGQLVLAGTSLIVVSEWGEVALVAATPTRFRRLAGFQPLKERTYNVPALADATIYPHPRPCLARPANRGERNHRVGVSRTRLSRNGTCCFRPTPEAPSPTRPDPMDAGPARYQTVRPGTRRGVRRWLGDPVGEQTRFWRAGCGDRYLGEARATGQSA